MKKQIKKSPKDTPKLIAEILEKFEGEGLEVKYIAKAIKASYQTTLTNLKKLEKAGYVSCYPHPEAEAGLINSNTKMWYLEAEGSEKYLYNNGQVDS